MQKLSFKTIILLFGLMLPTVWCSANHSFLTDGYSSVEIKTNGAQGTPKNNSIHAFIDGHTLSITFSENIGQVAVTVSTVDGYRVHHTMEFTPNGVLCYISNAGDYIVTIVLANGDEYYGEFTVTD